MSESEFQQRFEVFRENYKFVTEHNASEDNEGIKLAINQFSDMSPEAFVAKNTGLIISEERAQKMKDLKFGSVEFSEQKRRLNTGSTIPDHLNWYKKGHVTVPYNQETCGACWAFSTIAAVESLASISGYDKELTEYSVQQLIDCDTINYGCGGGWMYEGFAYVSDHGILKKEDYVFFSPYFQS